QLIRILDLELLHPGARPDQVHDGVRHRAPEHLGDTRERLQERGDLGTAELGHRGAVRKEGRDAAATYEGGRGASSWVRPAPAPPGPRRGAGPVWPRR